MSRTAFTRTQISMVLVLLLALWMTKAQAQSATPETAAERLKSVPIYAFGGVGFGGVISRGERDYRAILLAPHDQALRLFEDIFEHGNSQAKSYALAGIHKLDPSRFKELFDAVATSEDLVAIERGCIVSRRGLRDIAKEIGGRPELLARVSADGG